MFLKLTRKRKRHERVIFDRSHHQVFYKYNLTMIPIETERYIPLVSFITLKAKKAFFSIIHTFCVNFILFITFIPKI